MFYENGITKIISIRGGASVAAVAEVAQMSSAARAQFQGRDCGGGTVRFGIGMGDGLCGHLRGVSSDLENARSPVSERNSRSGKSDERKHRGMDLGPIKTETAVAYRNCRRGDVHGVLCVSG